MDYEKKYKETLEKARQLCAYPTTKPFISDLQDLFPELAESEDEKIRKAIIEHFADSHSSMYPYKGFTKKQILAWLEKQGKTSPILSNSSNIGKVEQNPADNKGMNLDEEAMTPFQKKVFCIIDTTIEEEQGLKQVCDELLRLAHDEIMQESFWSEEDSVMLGLCVDAASGYYNPDNKEKMKGWLYSLKDRVQPKQELNEDCEKFYYRTIGFLEKEINCDDEIKKQSALSCINWLKSVIEHKKIIKYKIGDRVRFLPFSEVYTISDIDEVNGRYISTSGESISFYEELTSAKGSLNKDDIKCGDYLTTENGTVIKVNYVGENEGVHYFYYAKEMTEDGGDIPRKPMYCCAYLSDCRRATQEEIDFLEKWVAHKKYVWDENDVIPDEDD